MSDKRGSGAVLKWETLKTVREEDGLMDSKYMTERAKVPGGWPDPKHEWDGGSLP